ncbi:MAG: 50S ribosomal protein L16 [Candidatus Helarchaeota archaeon]|nr:50S ribosomal protein L16 [Candidatus Helarchaeota archaeon]
MPRRPWSSYHNIKGKPYVKRWKKTKKGRREYVHGVPDPKIRMFSMGTNKDYEYRVILLSDANAQISHLALEAARIAANRQLRNKVGREDYFLRILVYPHHVVREHRMMAFAGADRLQDGMRKAFGKPFATAARVKRDQKLISVKVNKKHLPIAQHALSGARMKFPQHCHIEVVKLKQKEKPPLSEEASSVS